MDCKDVISAEHSIILGIQVKIMLIISYGLRRSEVLGLKWDAVDFENNTITIKAVLVMSGTEPTFVEDTKSKASRRVLPMSKELSSYLREVKDKQQADKEKYGNLYSDSGYLPPDAGELLTFPGVPCKI